MSGFTNLLIIAALLAYGAAITFFYYRARKRLTEEDKKNKHLLARYRSIIDTAEEGFWVVNAKTKKIVEVNDSICKMLGYEREELIGKTPFELTDEENRKILKEQASLDPEHCCNFTAHFLRKDGSKVLVHVKSSMVEEDGAEEGFRFAFIQDISEIEKTKEELNMLSTAIKQAGSSVVITDKEGNIVYVNPAFTEETGYTLEEAIGQNPRILKTEHHPPESYKELWDTISSGKKWKGTFKNKRKDGTIYWEDAVITPVINEKGEITNYIAIKSVITEKVELEERLKSTLKELNLILENAPIGIAYSKQRKLLKINPALARFWEGTVEELEGQDAIVFHPTRKQYELMGEKLSSLRPGEVLSEEVPLRTKTGKIKWARLLARPLDPHNPQQGSIWMVEDITQRKEWEQAIEKKNAILEAVSKASSLLLINEEAEKVAPEFLELLGKASGVTHLSVGRIRTKRDKVQMVELASWSKERGFSPKLNITLCSNEDPQFHSWMKELQKGNVVRFTPSLCQDKRSLMFNKDMGFECFVPIVVDEDLWGVLAIGPREKGSWQDPEIEAFRVAANLTAATIKRERVKREKEQEELKHTILVENARSIIVRSSPEGDILFMNRFGCEFFGYSRSEIVGKPLIGTIIPEIDSSGENRRETLAKILKRPEDYPYREVENILSDGRRVWIAWNHVALRDNRGKMTELLSIGHDMTAQKEIENRLREASEAKSAFLANMSHEIRTPLNAIIGMSQLLKETPLDEEQERLVSTVNNAGKALLSLINGILDLAKIEAGMMVFREEPFNLMEVVETCTDLFAHHSTNLSVICHVAPEVPHNLQGDSHKLGQVLRNLLGNAVKFTPQGFVALSISLGRQQKERAEIIFKVIDTGVGIPKDKLSAVFEPFTQAEEVTTKRFGGTGLGLSITKELVSGMGGSITIESREGEGTVVTVTIPFKLDKGHALYETDRLIEALKEERKHLRVLIFTKPLFWTTKVVEDLLKRAEIPCFVHQQPTSEILRTERDFKGRVIAIADEKIWEEEWFEAIKKLKETEEVNLHLLMLAHENRCRWCHSKYAGLIDRVIYKPISHKALLKPILDIAQKGRVVQRESESDKKVKLLSPKRILLVEDNQINQMLILKVLEKEGHRIEVAENGLKALELLADKEFDLVLMDVQMPVMDGFTATKIIRCCEKTHSPDLPPGTRVEVGKELLVRLSEKIKGKSIPIIALTAHAFEDQQEDAKEAGIDGYITKPFDIQEFRGTLRRFLKDDKEYAVSKEDSKEEKKEDPRLSEIRERLVSDFGMPEEDIPGFFKTAYETLIENLSEAEEAAKEKDYGKAQRAAHTLKGSLANLGLSGLSSMAKEVETAAKSKDESYPFVSTIKMLRRILDKKFRGTQ